jgi:hypothetical protein
MSWFRRNLGLDAFDLLVHVSLTFMVIFFVAMSGGPEEMFPVITGVSLVVLAVRRRIALKSGGATAGLTTGEMAAERIAELEDRVAELEAAQQDVAELAERLDFAERLLAQKGRDAAQIGPGGP